MLQHFLKLLRTTEHETIYPAGHPRGPLQDVSRPELQRPTREFLAELLRSALIQIRTEGRGGLAVHQPSHEPVTEDETEQPDGKVVRLMPRRPATEPVASPPMGDDDNDPGPSAA